MKRAGHHCPSYCHRCPELGGDVLPGCMGAAVCPEYWRERCTCTRPRYRAVPLDPIAELEKRVSKLEGEIQQLKRVCQ